MFMYVNHNIIFINDVSRRSRFVFMHIVWQIIDISVITKVWGLSMMFQYAAFLLLSSFMQLRRRRDSRSLVFYKFVPCKICLL